MTVEDVRRLYDHAQWADRRLLRVVSTLSPEEFVGTVGAYPRSIRDILVHLLSAGWGWISRCGGPERGPALRPGDFPTLEPLLETWRLVDGHVATFLGHLKDEDLRREASFTNPRGETRALPVIELLQHAAIHGVHHRAQVALMLRLLGRTPEPMDLLIYDGERRGLSLW